MAEAAEADPLSAHVELPCGMMLARATASPPEMVIDNSIPVVPILGPCLYVFNSNATPPADAAADELEPEVDNVQTPTAHKSRKRKYTNARSSTQLKRTPPTVPAASVPSGDLSREVLVEHPKRAPNMGTFGSYMTWLNVTHKHIPLEDYEPDDAGATKAHGDALQVRAKGFVMRTQDLLDDMKTRKLALTIKPPDTTGPTFAIYNMMRDAARDAAGGGPSHHYHFASALRIMRHPGSDRLIVTVDSEVAKLAEVQGFKVQPFDEMRTQGDLLAIMNSLPSASAPALAAASGGPSAAASAEAAPESAPESAPETEKPPETQDAVRARQQIPRARDRQRQQWRIC